MTVSELTTYEVSVLKDGLPYRLVELKDTSADHANRRATAAVFMADLRNDDDPKLRDHYTGELYEPVPKLEGER